MLPDQKLIEDVCAASAAYLFNVLPEMAKLPATERFERLKTHFETAFLAYQKERKDWRAFRCPHCNQLCRVPVKPETRVIPAPSRN